MIDRRPHLLFRRRTARVTVGTGVAIAGVLPAAGGVAAVLAAVAGLVPAGLTVAIWVLLATAAVGMAAVVAGILTAAVANARRDWYGAAALVTLSVAAVAGSAGWGLRATQPWLEHRAAEAADAGRAVTADLLTVWDERRVWVWAAVVPAAHLAVAGAYAVAVGLLRADEWAGQRFRRRWMLCRRGHAGTVRYHCPGCGDPIDGLKPSSAGLLYVRCLCGRRLPTTDRLRRSALRPVCSHCGDPLYPGVGRHAEYAMAVLGGPPAEQAEWLRRAVAELRPSTVDGLPQVEDSPTGSHQELVRLGRRTAVLHVDRYSNAAVERLPDGHPGYDGVILLLPWPSDTAAVNEALERAGRLLVSFSAAGYRPVSIRLAVCFIDNRPATPAADAGTWTDRLARTAAGSVRLKSDLFSLPDRPQAKMVVLDKVLDEARKRATEVRWFAVDPPARLADLGSDPADTLVWMTGLLG